MLVGDQKPKQKQKQKQQPWRISVHAKANNFDFKFMAATNILAVWGSSRLSLLFRLRAFALKVKSESKASTPKKRKSLKSKFLRFLGKFQPRSSKNKVAAPPETKTPLNHLTRFACEEPVCVSSLVIGGIALIFRWISEMYELEIILYSLTLLLCVVLLIKKFVNGRFSKILLISAAALMGFSNAFDLKTLLDYDGGYVLECVWKALNYANSST